MGERHGGEGVARLHKNRGAGGKFEHTFGREAGHRQSADCDGKPMPFSPAGGDQIRDDEAKQSRVDSGEPTIG